MTEPQTSNTNAPDANPLANGESFKNIILMKDGKLDLTRFKSLMDGVLEETAKKANVPAHKLVRVVQNGRVQWTTMQEARKMADFHRKAHLSDDSGELASAIEKAINGDINTLEDELLILLCMAESGGGDEILDKCRAHILEKSSDIREGETSLNKKKRETGVVDQFEEKLGLMINCRNAGQEKRASELASELRAAKSKYVLYTRSLAPDIQKIRCLRTELMRVKEKILEKMVDAVKSDSNGISFTVASLDQNVKKLEETYEKLIASNKNVNPDTLSALKERLANMEKALESKKDQAEGLTLQQESLQQELDTTRAVAKELDKGNDLGSAIEDQVENTQSRNKIDTRKSPEIAKQAVSRMARNDE